MFKNILSITVLGILSWAALTSWWPMEDTELWQDILALTLPVLTIDCFITFLYRPFTPLIENDKPGFARLIFGIAAFFGINSLIDPNR